MKVHLIAPSGSITDKKLKNAMENVRRLGFECKNLKGITQKYLYYAGTPKRRIEEINKALADPKSDIVFPVRGGMGAVSILESINYHKISSPKTLIGFSDITILLLALYSRTDVRCIHGPNIASKGLFTRGPGMETVHYLQKALNREDYRIGIKGNDSVIVEGYAKAEITGGNTILVGRTLGTPYEIDTKGKILFFEQLTGESPWVYDILWQLKLAGKFDSVKGVILGDFREASEDINDYLREFFKDFRIPVIMNQKIGHINPNISIPYGETCIIDTKNKFWEIKFKKSK